MNYRRLIQFQLMLVLILTLCTFIVYLPGGNEKNGEDDSVSVSEAVSLVNIPVYEISAAAVINERARFGLLHRDGSISLEPQAEGVKLSEEKLQTFLYRLSKLQAAGVLKKSPASDGYGEYGLDRPTARITLITVEGEKIRFSLGRENNADGSWYLLRDGDDRIFLLSGEDADLFITVPGDFESLRLLPRVELKDLDSVNSLSLEFPAGDLPAFTLENRGHLLFQLSAPIENSVSYEKVLSDLLFPVLSLSASERHSTASAMDVDIPEGEADMILTAVVDGERYRLSFYPGAFVRLEGDGDYYRLKDGMPGFRRLHYSDLLDGAAYHINVSEIRSLTVHDVDGDNDYNITLDGEAGELRSTVNGIDLDDSGTMDLFETLFRMTIARKLETPVSSDEAEGILEIMIHKKNGSLDRLQFVSREGDVLLYVDGTANFSSYNKTVLDIRTLLSRIAAKEGV